MMPYLFFWYLGEIDALITAIPHCHFVTGPVFGPPVMADKATLILVLSGDYRSKKEVAYTLVPAIARRVMDLGGNVEKGEITVLSSASSSPVLTTEPSTNHETHWQLFDPGVHGTYCRGIYGRGEVWSWARSRLRIHQR
jgi:hypothetical protein